MFVVVQQNILTTQVAADNHENFARKVVFDLFVEMRVALFRLWAICEHGDEQAADDVALNITLRN